jgi:hypothetical protein
MNLRALRRPAAGVVGKPAGRAGSRRTEGPGADLMTWLVRFVVAVGALNVIVLLAQARDTVRQLDLGADYPMSLVLPALSGQAPAGSIVTLGNHSYYEAWWFERLTIGLPHYRQIWEAAPFVVEGVGIAVVAWCAWVAIGRLAALLCTVALLSISDGLRIVVAMSGGRVGLTVHAGALCAALLIVGGAPRVPRLSRRALVAFTIFTVVFAAAAATDQLIAITVVIPYMLAPCLWWWHARSRQARDVCLYAVATGAAAIVLALIFVSVMQSEHIVHSFDPVLFATVASLTTNLQNLVGSWAVLGGGSFFGASASGSNLLTAVLGVICVVALVAAVWAVSRRAYALLAKAPPAPVTDSGRFLFVAFWAFVIATDLALYLGTQVSSDVVSGSHYLLSAWVAVAALLGAFVRSTRLRVTVLVGVAAFGLLTARAHIADGVPAYGPGPDQAQSAAIRDFARAHGATIGYAEYLDAPSVTWETALKTKVFPIGPCGGPASGLCPFFIDINTWYTPRANTRTFLLTDSRPAITGGSVTAPPAAFGKPIASAAIPPAFTVYVYRDDIAAQLGPQE